MKKILTFLVMTFFSVGAFSSDKPLLIIGASYANAGVPFNDNLQAPLGGGAVDFGSYLSLGNALVRTPLLDGHVINEAQAGATTFDRVACNPVCDPLVQWQGYDKQLTKALGRVTVPGGPVNADYVVITTANDCLHSDSFGIPQSDAIPCTLSDMNATVDRLIAVGQRALDAGVTPIYDIMPEWDALDLPFFQTAFGLNWAISETDYNQLRNLHKNRIANELPNAIQIDMWKRFEHRGDGIHPTDRTTKRAAMRIAVEMLWIQSAGI
ncbi:SGNH/GDSL hydrolase family protein [Alkalimarinus coralli]|uniref:SGNH/GDSL hydrolase family protein n=1 Tax=Alkalimarinus coralli TaxID=2935863 RepID=UPI00202B7AA8|nr:SGNH/GDSL hydrolase family protein [Alkalimarinus coralli]